GAAARPGRRCRDRRRAGRGPLLRGPAGRARGRGRRLPRGAPGRGVAVSEPLSDTARRDLLALARGSLEAFFRREPPPRLGSDRAESFGEPRAIFVTLRQRGELRGCIGTLAPGGDLSRA